MTVRNNLVIGSMFHNLENDCHYVCIIIFLAVRWHWGMWRLWSSDQENMDGSCTSVYFIRIRRFHTLFSQTIIHLSVTYGIAPTLLSSGSKGTSCSEMPWSVWLPLSPGVLLYISFLAISAFLTYLKNSNLCRGTTSRTGSFILPLKTAPTLVIFTDEEMCQMHVIRLSVGNIFSIVILF